jgi:hypothetical protein
MFVGHLGGDAASWCAVDEPGLHEVGFQHVFDGVPLFADGGGETVDAHGTAVEFLDESQEQFVVHLIQSHRIDFQHFQ